LHNFLSDVLKNLHGHQIALSKFDKTEYKMELDEIKGRELEEFGELDHEVARMFGLNIARAIADYTQNGSEGKFGIVPDDFRCDADSGQKLDYAVRRYDGFVIHY